MGGDNGKPDSTSATSSSEIRIVVEEQPTTSARRRTLSLRDLPPLPTPDVDVQKAESCRGIGLVLVLAALLVCLPHVTGSYRGPPSFALDAPAGRGGALVALYLIAAAALFCLGGLLFGDPGVVHRNEANCFPLPPSVQQKLEGRASLEGVSNVTAKNGRVFCVRCCVWRPATRRDIHHCSVCQRCVRYHDHHCGVFGRCIAGRSATLLSEGNL